MKKPGAKWLYTSSAILCAFLSMASPAFAIDANPRPSASEYQPQNEDERSLWLEMDEQERDIKNSPFLISDPEINGYLRSVLCKSVGAERCKSTRIYLMRTPQFNAMMAPNGMMIVWTGLLLRTRNEAELAAVLGHEFAHFDNQHSLQSFRDTRAKTDAMALFNMVPGGMLAQIGLMGSVLAFNRDMERNADMDSIRYMSAGGYDPMAASLIWEQLRAEMDVTVQGRHYRQMSDREDAVFFSSHPSSKQRMDYLREAALRLNIKNGDLGTERHRAVLSAWWPQLIDDQIKLNDFKTTEFLLESLARGKWTADLLYARGELYRARAKEDDFVKAAQFYRQAIKADPKVAESWRGLGFVLMRMGQKSEGQKALREYIARKPEASDHAMITAMAQ